MLVSPQIRGRQCRAAREVHPFAFLTAAVFGEMAFGWFGASLVRRPSSQAFLASAVDPLLANISAAAKAPRPAHPSMTNWNSRSRQARGSTIARLQPRAP